MFIAMRRVVLCGVMGGAAVVPAQDTRVVVEPTIPGICASVAARLTATPDANGGHLAVRDETRLDTARIQKAMDGCAPGHAVALTASRGHHAFLSGPLDLRAGVVLLVEKGVTVYGSRDPAVFDMAVGDAPNLCGTSAPRPKDLPLFSLNAAARPKGGCRALINVNGASNTGVMGEGTIDGRGYAKLTGHDYSWWEMARAAEPHDDLYYSTRLVVANRADNFILYGIHLVNSANFHVVVNGTNGFTAWGVHLQTPVDKSLRGTGNDARNTDGIDPGTSQNITIAHSWIDNGDDNVAVKQGVSHMSVLHNHFYNGHGMSIGSETVQGQSYLLVQDLTEDHTTSGIRIKSNVKRGGPVHDLLYEDVCMRGVPIPIAISPYYTNQTVEPFADPRYEGDKVPDYKDIVLRNILAETPGDVLIAGLNEEHRSEVTLENVVVKGIAPGQVHLFYDDLMVKGKGTNLALRGESVKVKGASGGSAVDGPDAAPDGCAARFVPMQQAGLCAKRICPIE